MKKILLSFCALMTASLATAQTGTQFFQGDAGSQNRRVSPNGKYVVGTGTETRQWGSESIKGYNSFIRDNETGITTWMTNYDSYAQMGMFADVNDDGVICGTIKDENNQITLTFGKTYTLPITTAAVWKNGEVVNLGLGNHTASDLTYFIDGTYATAISNDGKTVAGYTALGNYAQIYPCVWKLNETSGKYDFVEYAIPDNALTTTISDLSGDGSIAVGSVKFKGETWKTYPCYWPTPNECVVIRDPKYENAGQTTLRGEAFAISNNGKYIGITSDGKEPLLYTVEQDKILRRLGEYEGVSSMSIGGVTDNGDIYGEYSYSGYGKNRPFWFSMNDLMTLDFDYFIYLYGGEAQIPYKFDFWTGEKLSFSGASADGKVIAGNDTYGKPWILKTDKYTITIPPTLDNEVLTNATDLNEITVSFNRNAYENWTDYTAKKYMLFRDGKEITSFDVASLTEEDTKTVTYVDKGIEPGNHYYSVALLYDNTVKGTELLSPKTKEVKCYLESTHAFPLSDDFSSQSLGTNGWTVQRDYGKTGSQYFGCIPYFGLNNTPYCTTLSDQNVPYSFSLVSRHINAKDKENVYISFARKWQYANGDDWNIDKDTLSVEVSTDGHTWGVAKHLLLNEIQSNSWGFEYIDLTSLAAGKTFQVRFHLHGQAEAQMAWFLDNIRIDEKPQHEGTTAIGTATEDGKFRLIWKNSIGAYQLSYLANPTKNAYGLQLGNEGKEIIAANKFEPSDLKLYDGKYITSITTEITQAESTDPTPTRVAIVVYENGTLIREQEITDLAFNAYGTYKLDEPVAVDASKELMVGLKIIEHGVDQMPLVYHNTYNFYDGKSNIYSTDGGATWLSLNDYYKNVEGKETDGYACWLISANVTDTPEAASIDYDTNQYAYEVYKNGQICTPYLTHFLESGFTDESSVEGDTYEVRTFYLDNTVSQLSNAVKNSGYSAIEGVESAESLYTVENGVVTTTDRNAKVEIYDADGTKLGEGRGGVRLGNGIRGVVIMKVTGTDGTTRTIKLMR